MYVSSCNGVQRHHLHPLRSLYYIQTRTYGKHFTLCIPFSCAVVGYFKFNFLLSQKPPMITLSPTRELGGICSAMSICFLLLGALVYMLSSSAISLQFNIHYLSSAIEGSPLVWVNSFYDSLYSFKYAAFFIFLMARGAVNLIELSFRAGRHQVPLWTLPGYTSGSSHLIWAKVW